MDLDYLIFKYAESLTNYSVLEPNKNFNRICKKHFGAEPIKVEYDPWEYSKERDCYNNVSNFIKIMGGSTQYCWRLADRHPEIWTEFHALWRSEDGTLLDISPPLYECNEFSTCILVDHMLETKDIYNDGQQIVPSLNIIYDVPAAFKKLKKIAKKYNVQNVKKEMLLYSADKCEVRFA